MTDAQLVPVEPVDPFSEHVARRIRGALAESLISRTDVARALHVPQQKVSRKVLGQTPFTLDELQQLAIAFDVDLAELMGVGEYANRPLRQLVLTQGANLRGCRDSNPKPSDP